MPLRAVTASGQRNVVVAEISSERTAYLLPKATRYGWFVPVFILSLSVTNPVELTLSPDISGPYLSLKRFQRKTQESIKLDKMSSS